MEFTFDAVIIGGGPAGAACGLSILRSGSASCCIVDRAAFPRAKTCGGMMTEKTVRRLLELLSPFEEGLTQEALKERICLERCALVSIFDRTTLLASTEVGYEMTLVERRDFDALLLDTFKRRGGRVFEGVSNWKIDFEKKRLTLPGGDVLRYKTLVAADGANSRVGHLLKIKRSMRAFCIETHIPKDALSHETGVSIYINYLPGGYAWVFPAGDHYNVGFGNAYEKGFDYRAAFGRFLSEIGVEHPTDHLKKGAFLPYSPLPKGAVWGDSVLFVGDAGGFVDPIYGEGLYYALTSGQMAGKAICAGADPAKVYKKQSGQLGHEVRDGVLVRKIFYSRPIYRYFTKKLPGREPFLRYYADNQLSLARFPYRQTPKMLRTYKKEKAQYK